MSFGLYVISIEISSFFFRNSFDANNSSNSSPEDVFNNNEEFRLNFWIFWFVTPGSFRFSLLSDSDLDSDSDFFSFRFRFRLSFRFRFRFQIPDSDFRF